MNDFHVHVLSIFYYVCHLILFNYWWYFYAVKSVSSFFGLFFEISWETLWNALRHPFIPAPMFSGCCCPYFPGEETDYFNSKMGVEVLKPHVELALSNLVSLGFAFLVLCWSFLPLEIMSFTCLFFQYNYDARLTSYLCLDHSFRDHFCFLIYRHRIIACRFFIQDSSFVLKAVAKFLSSFPHINTVSSTNFCLSCSLCKNLC